jgi:hypothetical protein
MPCEGLHALAQVVGELWDHLLGVPYLAPEQAAFRCQEEVRILRRPPECSCAGQSAGASAGVRWNPPLSEGWGYQFDISPAGDDATARAHRVERALRFAAQSRARSLPALSHHTSW